MTKFATFDPTTGALTARYDASVNLSIPPNAVPLDDDTFMRTLNESDGVWTCKDGNTVSKVVPSAAELKARSDAAAWSAYQQQARTALVASDTTMHRCVENQVAVPAAWATYRKALRAIISASAGDPSIALPARPAYPAGT